MRLIVVMRINFTIIEILHVSVMYPKSVCFIFSSPSEILDGLNRMCRTKLFQTLLSFVFLEAWKYKDKKLMASGVCFLNYNVGDRFLTGDCFAIGNFFSAFLPIPLAACELARAFISPPPGLHLCNH